MTKPSPVAVVQVSNVALAGNPEPPPAPAFAPMEKLGLKNWMPDPPPPKNPPPPPPPPEPLLPLSLGAPCPSPFGVPWPEWLPPAAPPAD